MSVLIPSAGLIHEQSLSEMFRSVISTMYFDEAICDNFMRPSRAIIRAQEAGLLYYYWISFVKRNMAACVQVVRLVQFCDFSFYVFNVLFSSSCLVNGQK